MYEVLKVGGWNAGGMYAGGPYCKDGRCKGISGVAATPVPADVPPRKKLAGRVWAKPELAMGAADG